MAASPFSPGKNFDGWLRSCACLSVGNLVVLRLQGIAWGLMLVPLEPFSGGPVGGTSFCLREQP
jgi:hypothetical protein